MWLLQNLAELYRGIVGIQNFEEAHTLFPERQELNLLSDGLQTCCLHSFPGSFDVIHIYADVVDCAVVTLGIGFFLALTCLVLTLPEPANFTSSEFMISL